MVMATVGLGRGRFDGAGAFVFRDPYLVRVADPADAPLVEATDQWLKRLVDYTILPEARFLPRTDSARVYGTRLHALLADMIRLENRPGVEAESSFIGGEDVAYGEAGSVRTDVVLRNVRTQVIAVWDFKTSQKSKVEINTSRIAALQQAVKSKYGEVPVFVIHVQIYSRLALP